jgi:hypothetical protein
MRNIQISTKLNFDIYSIEIILHTQWFLYVSHSKHYLIIPRECRKEYQSKRKKIHHSILNEFELTINRINSILNCSICVCRRSII